VGRNPGGRCGLSMDFALMETGGTINGILSPQDPPPEQSRVAKWLQAQHAARHLHYSTRYICMKDSRALNDDDRARLAEAIREEPAERVLIPHGTYTMPKTGVFLRNHLDTLTLSKSIVLVGALLPLYAPESDAEAELNFALDALRDRPEGVWIAMQGQLWDPARVTKDVTTGRYVPTTQSG